MVELHILGGVFGPYHLQGLYSESARTISFIGIMQRIGAHLFPVVCPHKLASNSLSVVLSCRLFEASGSRSEENPSQPRFPLLLPSLRGPLLPFPFSPTALVSLLASLPPSDAAYTEVYRDASGRQPPSESQKRRYF